MSFSITVDDHEHREVASGSKVIPACISYTMFHSLRNAVARGSSTLWFSTTKAIRVLRKV